MYLFRVVYYSRNAVKKLGLPFSAEIRAIMSSCARHNTPAGLTGALVFNEQYFAQILEGSRNEVSKALWRIGADRRHEDMVIMEAEAVPCRRFENWSLGYVGHSEDMDALYLKFGITVGFDPARMTAASLVGFVSELVRLGGGVRHLSGGVAQPALRMPGRVTADDGVGSVAN
ncbi:Blue light- and temperature-regulated antirepressor YcgF [Methylobrevis pamukkalensis]|uniref:Blue light-and temperature-regulated antirepressor YcgF n=2 Tax=Methylobrevis pamukkalensis TaxID=1439726 RepID=A0A1E3GZV2_9HYPH|nr:Blue light- and temperature-regulated antirepressor YcgF [Methylobrevis pamukkalensis]